MRTAQNPSFNNPGSPGLLDAVNSSQNANQYVNAVLVQIKAGQLSIATFARQIGMFLIILAIVSAAIVDFIIYTLTHGKIREIAVLKLIGTRNRTYRDDDTPAGRCARYHRFRCEENSGHILGADISELRTP